MYGVSVKKIKVSTHHNQSYVTLKVIMIVPVSITQLAGTCIIICRTRGSNPGRPTYLY